MAILVTGGAGYIGSHTLVELLKQGYETVVLDNLVNSSVAALERVEDITGRKIAFYEGDIADREIYSEIFANHEIDACIHFAGLKAVGESVREPLEYYNVNVAGSLVLFEELLKRKVNKIIFSSSATVYGDPASIPITEECPRGKITSPYGRTKAMLEDILTDLTVANGGMRVILLRYFNPVGAHESGSIGEDPNGIPNNLMPYITQVAVGRLPELNIFGDDYDTPDGTPIRDYIHVMDLAEGHVRALEKLGVMGVECSVTKEDKSGSRVLVYNLGTGRGISVLDMVKTFSEESGVDIPYKIVSRRAGDVPELYCNADKAEKELGWTAGRDLKEMCRDSWNWQNKNPKGYEDKGKEGNYNG